MRVRDVMTEGAKTAESDRVIGIVTVSDLLELTGRGLDRWAVTSKRWALKHRAPHRKSRGVVGAW